RLGADHAEIAVHLLAHLACLTRGVVSRVALRQRRPRQGQTGYQQAADERLGHRTIQNARHQKISGFSSMFSRTSPASRYITSCVMLMLSSITIGSLGASIEMHPPASAEPSITITPAVALRFPMIQGLCARRAGLVKFALLMAFPRFRGAEWRVHREPVRPVRKG